MSDTEKYLFTDAERDAYAWGVRDAKEKIGDDEYEEIVSDSIYLGELRARNRIVSQLTEYMEDLKLCHKKDSCADIAYAVQGQIEEIQETFHERVLRANPAMQELVEATKMGQRMKANQLMARKNEIINSVVDYTLTPSQYDRATENLEKVIKGDKVQESYPADKVTEIENKAYEVGKSHGIYEGREEAFTEGMAEAHDVVYTTLERLQQSLNDTMGVYMDMPEDITRQNPEVRELSVMHAVLNQFREMFIDNYDEAMREHKSSKAWREDTDQLKSEWPEL